MYNKLQCRNVKYTSLKRTNQKFRKNKPWWINTLSTMWSEMSKAKTNWLKCKTNDKKVLKQFYIDKRKHFDGCVPRVKREDIKNAQKEIDDLLAAKPTEFLKQVSRIGIGNERMKNIPFETVLPDESICKNPIIVLEK